MLAFKVAKVPFAAFSSEKCYNRSKFKALGNQNQVTSQDAKIINYQKKQAGFTLLELVVGLAIFAILLSGVLAAFAALSNSVKAAREKTILASLASSYLEIARNLPYSQIGTVNGNPSGSLPDYTNAFTQSISPFTYKIYYDVTYVHDPADPLVGNPSYKQVKMEILNTQTKQLTDFVTTMAPQGLIVSPNTGALQLLVMDAAGNPVAGANIHITYPTTTPSMILDRQSGPDGQWIEVGLPAGVNAYRIVVTKTGYSTDQTYPITTANPNPTKPDATVVNGQVTKVSFSIDAFANLNIKTLTALCQPLSSVNLNVRGAKLIGTNPSVLKFNQNYSSAAGLIALPNIEWDTYTPTLLTGQSYIVYGTSPIQKIDVLPGTSQTFTMLLGNNSTANSLLVIVKDSSSGAALENAYVHLLKGDSTPQNYYLYSGGSVWVQNSWTGGSGQANWSASGATRYYQDSGTIDINSVPTGVRLKKIQTSPTRYSPSGWLESSSFDTGTTSTNFTILTWLPASQDQSTTLKFQVAANNDNLTWNYAGPDGTTGSFFTAPGADMGSNLDNKRYIRYKVYLSTTDNTKTPVLTSLNLNFVTGCFTPGQTIFTALTAGNNYSLDVSLAGYSTESIDSLDISGNQTIEILMSP